MNNCGEVTEEPVTENSNTTESYKHQHKMDLFSPIKHFIVGSSFRYVLIQHDILIHTLMYDNFG